MADSAVGSAGSTTSSSGKMVTKRRKLLGCAGVVISAYAACFTCASSVSMHRIGATMVISFTTIHISSTTAINRSAAC